MSTLDDPTKHRERDEFLSRVEAIFKLRHKNATIKRHEGIEDRVSYLDITEEDSGVTANYAVGAYTGGPEFAFNSFISVHNEYRQRDPGTRSILVYSTGIASDTVKGRAAAERIILKSFVEYQGLIDFRPYLSRQVQRFANDKVYVPAKYVNQRVIYHYGLNEEFSNHAYEIVKSWLFEERGRFVLVLGDFGTGKTFLLRELARRLGQEGGVVPIFIELRALDKSFSLDALIAAHLATSGMDAEIEKFRYMLREGRVVLLFDGFDELVNRVTYDRAMDHFQTLIQAAQGNAKVVVSSRTQHFWTDAQARSATTLGQRVEKMAGNRIAYLQGFDQQQIRHFLTNELNDEVLVAERVRLLNEVRDLMGLSENPRMLGFISELNEEELRSARSADGEVTAASLYETLIRRWLGFEVKRQEPRGAPLALNEQQRWHAVTELALCLWERTDPCIELSELGDKVRESIELLAEQNMTADEATHQVGSATLLVRDEQGRFSFIHQSVLEWLVANKAADEPDVLRRSSMSRLMAEFFRDLIGREEARDWVHEFLDSKNEIVVENALLVRERLEAVGVVQDILRLVNQDLRGRDFSGQDLDRAVFDGSDLTAATFVKTRLVQASFKNATLVGVDFTEANLTQARLDHADLNRASFLGTNRHGAQMEGAKVHRTKSLHAGLEIRPTYSTHIPLPISVVFSPLGDLLLSGHDDGNVRLWDIETRQLIGNLEGHQARVWSACFSPDGTKIASGSDDQSVRVWNTNSAQCTAILGQKNRVRSVCFSPDGKTIASGSNDHEVRLWDLESSQCTVTLNGHEGPVHSVCFSSDGKTIASGSSDHSVRLWDAETGQCIAIFEGHKKAVNSVCFTPDGSKIASGSSDHTVRLWDAETGQRTAIFKGHKEAVNSVCFSPDSSRIASGSNGKGLRLWNIESAHSIPPLEGHSSDVRSVCFSPTGDRIASGSNDGSVRLWDSESALCMATLQGYENWAWSVCYSPDGRKIACGSDDKSVRLWDTKSARCTETLKGHASVVRCVCFSPDGKAIASGSYDKSVRLWDTESTQCTAVLTGHKDWVCSVCFSPDGRKIASGSVDQKVRLWDVESAQCMTSLGGHKGWVNSVCFDASGKQIISGSLDRSLRLWDTESAQCIATLEGHREGVWSTCFSPDGKKIASGSHDKNVLVWDAESAQLMITLEGHEDRVANVCFSPDGKKIASASHDQSVRLWDAELAQCIAILAGHSGRIVGVHFNPDGTLIASASADQSIRIWDVASGRCLAVLVSLWEGWVAYTPEGRYKVGGDVAGGFWHQIGLCRYEVGELDRYWKFEDGSPLRVPDDEPLWR